MCLTSLREELAQLQLERAWVEARITEWEDRKLPDGEHDAERSAAIEAHYAQIRSLRTGRILLLTRQCEIEGQIYALED